MMDTVVQWIDRLTASGYPLKPHILHKLANTIQTLCVSGINKPLAIYMLYNTLRKQWYKHFLNHYKQLESIILESIEVVYLKETSMAVI